MPAPPFFRNLGLFADEAFLDSATCVRVREQICAAEARKGVIVGDGIEEGIVDESLRKVLCAEVDQSTFDLVKTKLLAIMPALERHFDVPLGGCDGPVFLRYGEQNFYKPHRDASADSPPDFRKRKVSIVIFLNAKSQEAAPGCYGGGSLKFYGLLKGPQMEKCGFPLDATPGLLIAFRSDTMHEVEPVTFGQRFTIVNWFTKED